MAGISGLLSRSAKSPDRIETRRRAPWLVLSLGFGGLLAFIFAAAWGTLLVLGRVQGDETSIRKAFLTRLASLDQIRSQIYLSGTYIRDLLLSPDAGSAQAQAARLMSLQSENHAALAAYARSLEAEEREPFAALNADVESYWKVLDRALAWTPGQRNTLRYEFFSNELVPRRTAMLQIADRIAAVNEGGLRRAEERLSASAGGLHNSLALTFGVTIAGGVLLAVLTIVFTLRLERELERRLEENARARADLRELSARLLRAQENERRSLARELHDEVGQALSAILMETDGAACAETPSALRDRLASIRSLAEKTVNEVRDIALLLRPSMLDDFGLVPALNWHAREMAKRTGLNILVSAQDSAGDLPEEHSTCIYRLVQEALNNAARHANARTVRVSVLREDQQILFTVHDDGAGFDTTYTRGLGLLGMEERVRRLGGSLAVESQPGCGTLIRARLPLIELAGKDVYAHSHPGG